MVMYKVKLPKYIIIFEICKELNLNKKVNYILILYCI